MNSIRDLLRRRSEITDPDIVQLLNTQSESENAVRTIFSVRDLASTRLSAAIRERDQNLHKYFGETAFVKLMTEQLLSHAIEDEGIDLRDVGPKMILALKTFFNTGKIRELWQVYEDVVSKQPIATEQVKLDLSGGSASIIASVAKEKGIDIPVSTSQFPLVPIIEETIADPNLCADLANNYHILINEFLQENEINKLCFIEKAVGPVGALGLMSSLVERTKIPCCVYRERYFADRGKISGSKLMAGDRVLLIYDLIVSGHGLRTVADNLNAHFRTNVIGAVVLFNFGSAREIKGDPSFPAKSVAYYSDYEEEILHYRNDRLELVNQLKKVVKGDVADARRQGKVRTPNMLALERGEDMKDDQSVVLRFGSVEDFEIAVEAFYNKKELSGYEIDTSDGISLIVPRSSLDQLSKLGVRFNLAA